MKPKKKLKNYKIDVAAPDAGVDAIALVKSPAIMVQWVAFEEAKKKETIKFAQDSKKRMLSGPFLIPDLPIYRYTEEEGEFTVTFEAQTIETIVKKFFKGKNVLNINEEHSDKIAPAYVIESWIIGDPETDKSKSFGFSLPKGTWFGTVYVEDEGYWNKMIESGEVLGFSVEGLMGLAMSQIKKDTMKLENKNTFILEDGTVIINKQDSAALAVGDEVMVLAEDGTTVEVVDGEYSLKDGTAFKVEAGFVTELTAPELVAAADVVSPAEVVTPVAVSEEEIKAVVTPLFEAFKSEVMKAVTDLNDRIAAIEAGSVDVTADVKEVKAAAEEMKKKFAAMPGAKFTTTTVDKSTTKYSSSFSSDVEKLMDLKKLLSKSEQNK